MIIAHLPAGYLLTKILSAKFPAARARSLWCCALAASVLPDIDIIWFHLAGGLRNHRYYPTHWPLTWLALALVAMVLLLIIKKRELLIYPLAALANVMLHLLLDILAGPVLYVAPLSWEKIQLIRVPAVYDWWVWNFIRHWTFQLELMIWVTAILIFSLSWRADRSDNI